MTTCGLSAWEKQMILKRIFIDSGGCLLQSYESAIWEIMQHFMKNARRCWALIINTSRSMSLKVVCCWDRLTTMQANKVVTTTYGQWNNMQSIQHCATWRSCWARQGSCWLTSVCELLTWTKSNSFKLFTRSIHCRWRGFLSRASKSILWSKSPKA